MTPVADFSSDIDLPAWYDRVQKKNKQDAARQRRRASRKRVNSSRSGGDRSRFEGDRSRFGENPSKSRGVREKNGRAPDLSVVVTIKS
jgi:hypothetical protein